MPDYSFRFRVDVASRSTLSSDAPVLRLLETPSGQHIELADSAGKQISKSQQLVLRARAWPTAQEATDAGQRFSDVFAVALVRHRVGVELWGRRGGGFVFAPGLQTLEALHGGRWLNDIPGLMVYQTDPPVSFVRPNATVQSGCSADAFIETFGTLAHTGIHLTDPERVAIDLFNASFFEPASDTRLLTLVMALEALVEPRRRSDDAVTLVRSFVDAVNRSQLSQSERDSLASQLGFLQTESISSAGRRLARERLGGRTYMGLDAPQFFTHCYDLRSRLMHGGDIRTELAGIGEASATLEVFVSDLLVARFLPTNT
jgi:hypothetical protein